jgi:hypothetical protein
MNALFIGLCVIIVFIIIVIVLVLGNKLSAKFVECSKGVAKILQCNEKQAQCFLKYLADNKIQPKVYQKICQARNKKNVPNIAELFGGEDMMQPKDMYIMSEALKHCNINNTYLPTIPYSFVSSL